MKLNKTDIDKNEKTVKIIKDMIKSDKIPGAFIFESERGDIRTLFAEDLAKTIVCGDLEYKAKYGEACGVCESCAKADKKIHPDIIVSEPEGEGSLSFHIDKVRDIINGLYLTPNESEKKAYIIKDMQNMTPQGQNALLKSIEEPPPFAVFIITVNSGDLILETVKSRAVRFVLDCGDDDPKKNMPPVFNDLARDILNETSDKLSLYQKLLSSVLEKNDKTEVLKFYSYLENSLRDILVAKIFMSYENDSNNISFLSDFSNPENIKKIMNLYSIKKILNLSKKIQKYKADLDYNINLRLNLTSFLSGM